MLIEEFGPNITYIKGSTNTIADALSRLNFSGNISNKKYNKLFYAVVKIITKTDINYATRALLPEDIDNNFYPLDIEDIALAQLTDSELNEYLKKKSERVYTKKSS